MSNLESLKDNALVRRLVFAVREIAFIDPPAGMQEEFAELQAASEEFAAIYPWENQPDDGCGWCKDGWPRLEYNGQTLHSLAEPMGQVPCETPDV